MCSFNISAMVNLARTIYGFNTLIVSHQGAEDIHKAWLDVFDLTTKIHDQLYSQAAYKIPARLSSAVTSYWEDQVTRCEQGNTISCPMHITKY